MSFARSFFKGLMLGFGLFAFLKFLQLRKEAKLLAETVTQLDYTPLEPDMRKVEQLSHAVVAWQVGYVQVRGIENINKFDSSEPLIVIANHSNYADPSVLFTALRRKCFWLTTTGVMKFAGGLGAYLLRDCGMLPIEILPHLAVRALKPCSELVAAGNTLVIFPEGWVHLDGKGGEFKPGVSVIARQVEEKIGRPVNIVPIFISYEKYPSQPIARLPVPFDYLATLILGPFYKAGATVSIGAALQSSELPPNSAEAAQLLQNSVLSLDPEIKG